MNANFTQVVNGTTFLMPQGSKIIMLQNIGGGSVLWTGTKKAGSFVSAPVALQTGDTFTFPYLADGWGEILFDATASILQINAVYGDLHG